MDLVGRLRARFEGRCGYCGVLDEDVGATLTVDHHRPRKRDGGDDDANLVYCCPRCNEHKGSYWHEDDPPGIPLLNPGSDDLAQHVRPLDDGCVEGVSERGTFLITRLRLNRPVLVRYRARKRERETLEAELHATRSRVRVLEEEIATLNAEIVATEAAVEREGR